MIGCVGSFPHREKTQYFQTGSAFNRDLVQEHLFHQGMQDKNYPGASLELNLSIIAPANCRSEEGEIIYSQSTCLWLGRVKEHLPLLAHGCKVALPKDIASSCNVADSPQQGRCCQRQSGEDARGTFPKIGEVGSPAALGTGHLKSPHPPQLAYLRTSN
jgi:hypothetical protein